MLRTQRISIFTRRKMVETTTYNQTAIPSEDDFDTLLLMLHHEIVSESVSDVYSGHSRCEKVATIDGVSYYNDSLSSSIPNALEALQFIPEKRIVWIMNESDAISKLHKLSKVIQEKVMGIIVIGDYNSQTMLKLMDYSTIILGANSTTEAVELSQFFTNTTEAIIFSPSSPIFTKAEKNQDQGSLFKKAVKTLEILKEKERMAAA
jgi:UDP-N-acetylmuramoylalanine--D-glutamate ligase